MYFYAFIPCQDCHCPAVKFLFIVFLSEILIRRTNSHPVSFHHFSCVCSCVWLYMLLPQRVNGSEIVTPAGEGWRSEAAENDAMTKKELKKKKGTEIWCKVTTWSPQWLSAFANLKDLQRHLTFLQFVCNLNNIQEHTLDTGFTPATSHTRSHIMKYTHRHSVRRTNHQLLFSGPVCEWDFHGREGGGGRRQEAGRQRCVCRNSSVTEENISTASSLSSSSSFLLSVLSHFAHVWSCSFLFFFFFLLNSLTLFVPFENSAFRCTAASEQLSFLFLLRTFSLTHHHRPACFHSYSTLK